MIDMAKKTYLMQDGTTKTFDTARFRALMRCKWESPGTGRKSQNTAMMELADSIHVSFSAVKHWYNGHNAPGNMGIVSQIAAYFGIAPDQLLAAREDPPDL